MVKQKIGIDTLGIRISIYQKKFNFRHDCACPATHTFFLYRKHLLKCKRTNHRQTLLYIFGETIYFSVVTKKKKNLIRDVPEMKKTNHQFSTNKSKF